MGKIVVNLYRKGRIAERKVANLLADEGYYNIRRSAGSRGPADLYARKGDNKYYIQVKTGSAVANPKEIKRLRALARKRGGTAVVIKYNRGKKTVRYYGHW
jgi:Holliday junction resolvase